MQLMDAQQSKKYDDDFWFDLSRNTSYGILKQTYLSDFPRDQTPQGQFYCSAGRQKRLRRDCIEDHLDQCLEAGLNVEGINAEVACGQWEYQIFARAQRTQATKSGLHLAERNAEKYGLHIEWHPKPLGATDWNGGMHANFSDTQERRRWRRIDDKDM